jgi:hypothetical protein
VLDCAFVLPLAFSTIPRLAQAQGLAAFLAYDEYNNHIPVLIRLGDGNALTKQFGSRRKHLPGKKIRTRKLRGVLTPLDEDYFGHYLRYEGAKKLTSSEAARESEKEGDDPPKEKVSFDEGAFSSFSYDGKRLVEPRVVDVGPEGVVVTSKDSISVIVPLDKAIKMPDLRMRAKAAMEAAVAAGPPSE